MKRKKKNYLEYDYESAYKENIDKIEENQMLNLLRQEGKVVYATKEIRAGNQLDVEIYPCFTRRQKDMIPNEGRRKKQRQAQKNLNEKNSRKMCERLINANFTDKDILVTLTYTDETMPEDMRQANKEMTKYIKRLNYRRKKSGLDNAKYIYVTECSARGRWHHHMLIDSDMSIDVVEKVWTAGKKNQVRRLQSDEEGLTAVARYLTKSSNNEREKGQKLWTSSRGLKRPEEKVTHYKIKAKDVNAVVKNANVLQDILDRLFAKQGYILRSQSIMCNTFNHRFYIQARMSRLIQKSERRKNFSEKGD